MGGVEQGKTLWEVVVYFCDSGFGILNRGAEALVALAGALRENPGTTGELLQAETIIW